MSLFRKIISIFQSSKSIESPSPKHHVVQESKVEPESSLNRNSIQLTTLKPVEILLLSYVQGLTDPIEFPGYFRYRYESDPNKLLTKLVRDGYLSTSLNIEENIQKSTVPTIKAILLEKSLKTSGKKAELIERLKENFNEEELKERFPKQTYQATEKGMQVINENDHIWYFHSQQHVGVSIEEGHREKQRNPKLTKFELGYQILNQQKKEHWNKGNFGLYRNTLLGISTLLKDENRLEESLHNLFEICLVDLSGMGNNFSKDYLSIYEDHFFPYENSLHTLAPGIIARLNDLKEMLDLSDSNFKQCFDTVASRFKPPFRLFTDDEAFQIIDAELKNDQDKVRSIYKVVEKNYKKHKK